MSFREDAHRLVDWIADYLENVEQYPVLSPVALPCDSLEASPPCPARV